ncbi:AlpA family phage regulatory protein [Rhizobium sp. NLR8a]|uniref:helix-turn-helix transcriptional regulator n=1 Tax=Rhizobium sp. NLR8a TaxID=2731119 RepID=UPI001C83288A|nr:AlpA family phage regulatory protein [Rhizobium sp. NLR8a]MBX5218751.1 AlpA family phage regulatory protein [Rhizobium sp. NLR8a]
MIFNDPVGFYTAREVCRITTLSRRSLYRYLDKGRFPYPVEFSKRRKVWWIPDVHQWIREQLRKPRR